MIFKDRERYDSLISMRAPKALVSKTAKIAQQEKQSANEGRVRLLEAGIASYEWLEANWDRLAVIRELHPEAKDLDLPQLVTMLMEMALVEAERRHSPKKK